ncbi:hypothetical protein [Leucobacter sp. GX24907]
MTYLNDDSRRIAVGALALIMISTIVAWLLFVAGQYAEIVTGVDELFGDVGSIERMTWSHYLTVGAITLLGGGALFAKRRLAQIKAGDTSRSRLVDAVSQLASVTLIIAASLATWAVFVMFMSGFFMNESAPEASVRIVNLYLPIVLYTVLVVGLILAGFVFLPASVVAESDAHESVHSMGAAPVTSAPDSTASQRTTAFAYATPIIAAAIALVLGLIVYDLTRTALQVWIWVVVLVIIGAGVLVGALLARSACPSDGIGLPASSVARGAKNLNFVLSIVFAVVVTGMSLGYGMSAVYGLNIAPSLMISVYGDEYAGEVPDGDAESDTADGSVEMQHPEVSVWGSDLKRGSEGVLMLEPEGATVSSATVDRDAWLSFEEALPGDLAAGEYTLIARATATDGAHLEAELPFTATESGKTVFPEGSEAGFESGTSRLLPVTARWIFGDLVPAGVLLVLGITLTSTTMIVRNRDE